MGSGSRTRSSLVILVVFAGIAAGVLTLAGANSGSVPDLACHRVNAATGDYAVEPHGAASAEEAVLQTEWWLILEVPDEARTIVTDTDEPANGIVALPVKTDGAITDAEAGGGLKFQVYVKSEAVARISVTKSSNDTYFVSGLSYC